MINGVRLLTHALGVFSAETDDEDIVFYKYDVPVIIPNPPVPVVRLPQQQLLFNVRAARRELREGEIKIEELKLEKEMAEQKIQTLKLKEELNASIHHLNKLQTESLVNNYNLKRFRDLATSESNLSSLCETFRPRRSKSFVHATKTNAFKQPKKNA